VKFLIDMNLPPRWVGVLGAEGIDAVHWSTVGAANAADAEIMCFARVKEFVVLTRDLDTGSSRRRPPRALCSTNPKATEAVCLVREAR
jgi:predicted nuclease of predicted toxin-antitoxin system